MAGKRGQNEGSIFKRADGRWCAQMNLGYINGKRKRKYFYGDTRREVQERLTKTLRDIQQGLPIASERLTVEQFLTRWLEDSVRSSVRPRTYAEYEMRTRNHFIPTFGKVALEKLTAQHVQAFVADRLADGLSPRYVRTLLTTFRQALNRAVRWGLVQRNVASLVDTPKVERKEERILAPDDARRFLESAKEDRLESLYWVLLTTALRSGEARGLRWQDIDLAAGTLTVRVQVQRVNGTMQLVPPKTEKSRRTIAVAPVTVAALKRQRARQREERLLAGSRWQENGLVFTGITGGPVDTATFARKLSLALTRAGLPSMSPHRLRHSAATFMAVAGVNPRIAMDALGHADLAMTMGIYQHVTATMQRDVANGMEMLLTDTA